MNIDKLTGSMQLRLMGKRSACDLIPVFIRVTDDVDLETVRLATGTEIAEITPVIGCRITGDVARRLTDHDWCLSVSLAGRFDVEPAAGPCGSIQRRPVAEARPAVTDEAGGSAGRPEVIDLAEPSSPSGVSGQDHGRRDRLPGYSPDRLPAVG